MRHVKKITGLMLILATGVIFNSCRITEAGFQFLPDTGYSASISNTDLKVLEVTSYESATGIRKSVLLAPVFSSGVYNYNISIDTLVTSVTVVAVAADDRSVVAINASECTSRSIEVSGVPSAVEVEVTAPDGVTKKSTLVGITRSIGIEESRLLNFEVCDEDNNPILLSPVFDPDGSSYRLRVPWNSYYVKVKPTSISTLTALKINGSLAVSGEKELVILSSIPVGSTTTTQTITVTSTASSGAVSTYTFTVSRLGQSVVSANSAYLSGLKVTMGTNSSERQIYRDMDDNFFPDNENPFDKTISKYSCVVFGFSTVNVVITPENPSVSSLMVDGVEMKSAMESGRLTVPVTWTAGDYSVKTLSITVVSGDGSETRDYSLKLRLLNIYEFVVGLGGPIMRANKAEWGNPGNPVWTKTFNGRISGNMVWSVTWVTTLSTAKNHMSLTNYNNGDYGIIFVGKNGGMKMSGVMSVIVNTSGTQTDGPQTGDMIVQTPEGDTVAFFHMHYKIANRDVVPRDPESYQTVDYMGQAGVKLYYNDVPTKPNLSSAYWDPATPWVATDLWLP